MKSKHINTDTQFLRQKAEKFLKKKSLTGLMPLTRTETMKLIQELEVHQIELKLQNEELMQARTEALLLAEKYSELYDFAPIGYFTVSRNAEIKELNHFGAQMFGKVHSQIINTQFGLFVSKDTISIFNHFIEKVFTNKYKQCCEITIISTKNESIYVQLDGIIGINSDQCLITAVDISNRKLLEDELKESEMFLKKTQQIANLGTFMLDFTVQTWESSEVLDSIFGIDITYDKTLDSWKSIIHPDYQETIMNYLLKEVIGKKTKFNKEYKIIRQNDKAERWIHAIDDLEVSEDDNNHYKLIGTIRDITDRKHAEEERKYLLAAVENVVDRVVVKDLDFKVVAANKAWIKARGKSSIKEVLGLTDVDLFGIPIDAEPVRTWIEDEMKVKKLLEGEFMTKEQPVQLATGENTIALVRRFPIYDDAGVLFCIGTIATDITERKRMEDELKENELFLSQTQVIANLGSYISNIPDGTWKCSNILNDILGIEPEYIKTYETWISIIHPYWRDKMVNYYENEVLKNKIDFNFEYKIIRQNDKAERWVHGIGKVEYNENQEPISMIGTIQDITQRKEVEAQVLRNLKFTEALLNSIPIPVFFKDVNGAYLGCNQAFTDHSGFTDEYIKGKTMIDLWPNEQSIIYHQKDLDALTNQIPQFYEAKVLNADNMICNTLYVKNIFYDENGAVAGIIGAYIDITDRKRTEALLAENHAMLTAILESSTLPIFSIDHNYRYTAFNKAHATYMNLLYGVEIELENSILDYITEENDRVAAKINIDRALNGEHLVVTTFSGTQELKRLYLDIVHNPIFDLNGKILGVSVFVRDLTERKLAEEAIRMSEEKYRTVANYTNDWEFWIDEYDNFIYCSPSCERITGYKAIEYIQNPKLQYSIVHPDDLQFFQSHRQMEDLLEEGHSEVQFRIIRPDGETRWIGHVSRPIFNESNKFVGIRGSNRDITERKEMEDKLIRSEHKYKLISENISDGVFICQNGHLEYVNEALSRLFGYEDIELLNRQFIQLVDQDFKGDLDTFLSSNASTNKLLNMELKCVKKDLSTFYVDLLINYVASEKIFYGVAHDVTEKKQIQRKNIIKAIIQTEEKEKSYFSKELHDGLGPLLSTIKLYLQWSTRQKSSELRDEILQKAEKILEEALMTVTEISNKLSPHLLQDYGLTSAIQSFVNKLVTTSVVKVNFKSNLERRLDLEIEVAFYRAIIECVNNTIKHAQAKNIEIKLNDMGNHIVLKYIDDGIGFDYDKVISEQKGLGLFNLKNRIQTIGGKLRLSSEPGHGVDYQITIDVKQK